MADLKIVSIIPARGGSKGIPNKNIINIAGKPLIGWTIEQSINTNSINKTYVTTNDSKIAEISKEYGAEIIWRPENLSGDIATSESAILHALDYLKSTGTLEPDYVVFLQATSPLRKPDDIQKAIDRIIVDGADSLFSGAIFEDLLFWVNKKGAWESLNYDYKNRGIRQDRNPQFAENGSIYIFKPEVLKEYNNRIGRNFSLYKMQFWQTWQIDTEEDIELVEYFLEKKIKKRIDIGPDNIELMVYDFDGIMTNNKAIVNQEGQESVIVSRSDGLAISELRKMHIPQIIISTEKNDVVQKRAEKLQIPCIHGVGDKKSVLLEYTKTNQIDLAKVVYFGNDINDLEAMKIAGTPISPADAIEAVKKIAKIITSSNGGDGVIREFYERLKMNIDENNNLSKN